MSKKFGKKDLVIIVSVVGPMALSVARTCRYSLWLFARWRRSRHGHRRLGSEYETESQRTENNHMQGKAQR